MSRNEMNAEQQKVYDATVATTGRVGRGPSVGYAYAPGLWQVHNASSAHLLDCSLTPAQVRIVSPQILMLFHSTVEAESRAGREP